jgi:hypothetical protein
MLAKPIVDVGSGFTGFEAVVPRMDNISTDFAYIMRAHGRDGAIHCSFFSGTLVKSFQEEIHPYDKHIRLLHGVHVFLFGLVLLFTPPRIGYHLIDESRGSINGE